jgi:hypothetical protein
MYSRLYWITTGIRDGIFKLLRSPGIESEEPIPPAYVAPAGRYDNPVPTRFLTPIDCSKILAQQQEKRAGEGERGASNDPPPPHRSARLHRLTESIPWNQFLVSFKV